jgi:hypothetical protein
MAKFIQIEGCFINLDCVSYFETDGNTLTIFLVGKELPLIYTDERSREMQAKLFDSLGTPEKWEISAVKLIGPYSSQGAFVEID